MPDGNAAAQRVLGIAKILNQLDYKVRFSGLSRNIKSPETGYIDSFSYVNYPYPNSVKAWGKYLTGHDTSINEIKEYDPDLVILYNHPAIAIEHITNFCHKKGIRVIADVTEWYKPNGNPLFKIIKGYDVKRRMHKSHLKVDGLICISSFLNNFYDQLGVKTTEIPALIDIDQPKWHQEINYIHDGIKLIYAGSPGYSKDRLDLILLALDEIIPTINKKIQFDIIGITEEQYKKTWKDNTIRNYVKFNGRIPHNEVIKKLLEADFQIFLRPDTLPNLAGFPTKFTETISSGTLPITNLSSNLEKYLIDGKTGFVITTLDKSSIYSTIKSALSYNYNEINKMKQNLDTKTFDYRRYVNKLECFLKYE